jgi:subtilase family serine protease
MPSFRRTRSMSARRSRPLQVESLEVREMLNATPFPDLTQVPLPHPVLSISAQHDHARLQANHRHDSQGHNEHFAQHPGHALLSEAALRLQAHSWQGRHGVSSFASPASDPGGWDGPPASHRPIRFTPNSSPSPVGYAPNQLQHAYGFDQPILVNGTPTTLDGSGQTIAIIDAYDDPYIIDEITTFSTQYGLPRVEAGFNFTKATPQGTPSPDSGWATEIALDVEWAHAIAPKASILLVEAKSASYADLFGAVDYARQQGAQQISMSFGGQEFFVTSYDSHFNYPGVSFVASSGDNGAGVSYPATSPYVTAAGGTTLSLDSNNNRVSESGWSGSGGGLSSRESLPSYQEGFVNSKKKRGNPDISYDADPATGVAVYHIDPNTGNGGWDQYGGTSIAAPQITAMFALANQGRALSSKLTLGTDYTFGTNQVLYKLAGDTSYTNPKNDYLNITTGNNITSDFAYQTYSKLSITS